MNLPELFAARRSCRQYIQRPVTPEDITQCLEAARLAPSACNSQPWHFYAVSEEAKRQALALTTQVRPPTNTFTNQAPVLIVVTAEREPQVMPHVKASLGAAYFSDIDIGLSVGYLTLQATELGLATCIMGVFDEAAIRGLLPIPDSENIRLVIALGYAADDDRTHVKNRRPAEENMKCF